MRHLIGSGFILSALIHCVSCSNEPSGAYQRSYKQTQTKTAEAASENPPASAGDVKTEVKAEEKRANEDPASSQSALPPAPSKGSGGKGGGTGLLEVPFTDSKGTASSYKINAPADPKVVQGLHIHLHGDGGGGYVDFPNKELRYDLISVTVKAPNANLTWGRAQGRQHAFYLNDLIQNELLKKYDIDPSKIFFSTVSGGSYFLTGSFVPEFGQFYKSAALVMCGGEAPRVAFTDPKVLGQFRLHWEVTAGERADISTSVQASVAAYKNASASAGVAAGDQTKLQTLSVEGAGGHCEFDGVSYTSGIQQMIDKKFKSILP